uniref:Uncharacterized protein n=1 Tax=Meloidogyne enterolobii TaxID=390850 RepID=A0A6V7W7Y5_MELEN|nr:unnamed protein product [Meloidogyne enterolobii]
MNFCKNKMNIKCKFMLLLMMPYRLCKMLLNNNNRYNNCKFQKSLKIVFLLC